MHAPLSHRIAGLAIGTAGGAGLALAARSHPAWTLEHPGTIALGLVGIVLLAGLYVQARMNRVVREHHDRAEGFRLAMLAQFAPELLAAETGIPAPAPAEPVLTDEMRAAMLAEPVNVT